MTKRCPHCGQRARKLSPQQVREIRRSGEKTAFLAKKYNVSEPLISYVRNRKAYEWVEDTA